MRRWRSTRRLTPPTRETPIFPRSRSRRTCCSIRRSELKSSQHILVCVHFLIYNRLFDHRDFKEIGKMWKVSVRRRRRCVCAGGVMYRIWRSNTRKRRSSMMRK